MTNRDTIIGLNSQLYFLDNRLVFWIKFYLLNSSLFRSAFSAEYETWLKEFRADPKYMGSLPIDFDRLLNIHNQESLISCLDDLLEKESFAGQDILKKAFGSALVQWHDKKMIGKIIADNLSRVTSLMELFSFLRTCIRNNSFYDLSLVAASDLVGNWISTRETDQLRINYNMTDLTPLGSQVRLQIDNDVDEFHSFQCFAKAIDYTNSRVGEISVFRTRIKILDGYIHHYHINGSQFLYKRPIYGFNENGFATQTDQIEFVFERSSDV